MCECVSELGTDLLRITQMLCVRREEHERVTARPSFVGRYDWRNQITGKRRSDESPPLAWTDFQNSIAPQPRGCEKSPILLRKALDEIFRKPLAVPGVGTILVVEQPSFETLSPHLTVHQHRAWQYGTVQRVCRGRTRHHTGKPVDPRENALRRISCHTDLGSYSWYRRA